MKLFISPATSSSSRGAKPTSPLIYMNKSSSMLVLVIAQKLRFGAQRLASDSYGPMQKLSVQSSPESLGFSDYLPNSQFPPYFTLVEAVLS